MKEADFKEVLSIKKPTQHGIMNSIEVFNNHGELLIQFYESLSPDDPESYKWKEGIRFVEQSFPV